MPYNIQEFNKEQNTEKEVTILAKGASIGMVGKIVGRGISFLTQIIVARFLGTTAFGLFSVGWSVARILEVVGPLGMQHAIIRFGSESWFNKRDILKTFITQTLFWMSFVGLCWGGIIYVKASWLGELFSTNELYGVFRVFAWAIPFIVVLQIASAATRVSKRMKFSTLGQDVGQPLINFMLILLFLLTGLTLTKSIIALIISYSGALLLTLYFLNILFPGIFRFQLQTQRSQLVHPSTLLKFAFSASTVDSLPTLFGWGMHLLLAYFRPASDIGIYQAAFQLSAIFSMAFLPGINAIFAPMAAALHEQQRHKELEEIYRVSTKWAVYLSIPFFVLILHSPTLLLNVLYGADYKAGASILVLLAVAQFVNVATGSVGNLLVNTGRQKSWAHFTLGSTVIGIVLGFLYVPEWGALGAAIANGTALVFMYVSGLVFARKSLGYWPYDKRYIKGLLAGGMSICILFLLRSWHLLNGIDNTGLLIIYFIASTTLFAFTLLFLRLDPDDKIAVALLKERFSRYLQHET